MVVRQAAGRIVADCCCRMAALAGVEEAVREALQEAEDSSGPDQVEVEGRGEGDSAVRADRVHSGMGLHCRESSGTAGIWAVVVLEAALALAVETLMERVTAVRSSVAGQRAHSSSGAACRPVHSALQLALEAPTMAAGLPLASRFHAVLHARHSDPAAGSRSAAEASEPDVGICAAV